MEGRQSQQKRRARRRSSQNLYWDIADRGAAQSSDEEDPEPHAEHEQPAAKGKFAFLLPPAASYRQVLRDDSLCSLVT